MPAANNAPKQPTAYHNFLMVGFRPKEDSPEEMEPYEIVMKARDPNHAKRYLRHKWGIKNGERITVSKTNKPQQMFAMMF